jgi:hypothetical protein
MNNILNILFEKAGREKSPKVNVADNVIAIISANEKQTEWFRNKPLMWIAALSSAVAVPFVITAFVLHNLWIGPLFEISQVISWVM